MKIYKSGLISYEEAMAQCTNPDDFDLRVKGITSASDKGWQEFEESTDKADDFTF
jgi:twitching motility protein PilT